MLRSQLARRARRLHALVCLACAPLLAGCLFRTARDGLERLRAERGEPWAVTVFRAAPASGEKPIAELRATLEYWSGISRGGEPRWRGVLVPEPGDLYARVLGAIEGGAAGITLKAYRYDAAGLDDITLVDYFDSGGALLGSDHMALAELEPAPGGEEIVGYFNLEWWEYPQLLLDLPFYLAIGLKEMAGEVVKSPLSFISSGWIGPAIQGRSPFSPVSLERSALAFVEDWRNGLSAFAWRFRARSRHTPLDLIHDLAAAVPVAGLLVDHSSPPADSAPPATTSVIAVSSGVHLGGDDEQYLTAWKHAIEAARPGTIAVIAPYRYGSVFDTLWSMLNLSHGTAYDLASRLVFDEGVGERDAVELLGFSGGAQRSVAASRALRVANISVNRIAGVAGPVLGNSCAFESTLLLGEGWTDDPIVGVSRGLDLLFWLFPSNVRRMTVSGAGGHHLPYLPDGATRAPQLGYVPRIEALLKAP